VEDSAGGGDLVLGFSEEGWNSGAGCEATKGPSGVEVVIADPFAFDGNIEFYLGAGCATRQYG